MKNRYRFWRWRGVAVAAALTTAGCGGVRYPQSYVMDLQPASPPAASTQEALGPLLVREFRCPDYVCDGRIVYRPAPHEVGFYQYHRWAVSPRQMITESVADRARTMALFTSVSVRGRNADAAYILTGEVQRLEEVDRPGGVHAVCVLAAELIEVATKHTIWTGSETATVPVNERNMTGVVAGLSAATRAAVDGLVRSLQQRLESIRSEQ